MCKIVIYSCGRGGEAFAEMVENELGVMEVIRVADGSSGDNDAALRRRVEAKIEKYIGNADVIVLASYRATAVALRHLRIKYPEQKFIGMGWPTITPKEGRILVLTTNPVRASWAFMRVRRRWSGRVAIRSIDVDMKSPEEIEQEIKHMMRRLRWTRPKNVVLGSTELMLMRGEIEKICGNARVLEASRVTIKNLCKALEIKDQMRVGRY